MTRPRALALGMVVAVAVGAGGLVAAQQSGAQGAAPTSPEIATHLVPVVRATLVATQPVSGEVGSSETWSVGLAAGSTPDEVAAAADAVAAAIDHVGQARSALAAASRARTVVLARDGAAVTAARSGPGREEALRVRTLDRIEQDGAVSMARSAVADAGRALAAAQRDLAARRHDEAGGGGTLTAIPVPGAAVARGDLLYALDGRPTVLLLGTTPAYRALRESDLGPDVAQLQANLVALGFGGSPPLRTDGTFDHPTTLAMMRWQTSRHLEANGILRLGDAVFLPAEVRTVATHVAVGGGTTPGSLVLEVASVEQVVKIDLDPSLAGRAHTGDAIRFSSPDGTSISGRIVSVGAPMIEADAGGNGPPGRLVVPVVARSNDPAALAALGGAGLTAEITTATAVDVLVVPVRALVVLADGQFGIEVAAAGRTHFVAVTPGIFDRTMVEIAATGVAEGDQVVVPGG